MKKSYQQKSCFILSSALLHTLLFGFFWLTDFIRPAEEVVENMIEVTFVNTETPLLQIAQQDEASVNEEIPSEAKFLSAKNQRVNQETRAANTGKFNNQVGQQGLDSQAQTSKKPTKKSLSLQDLSPDTDWFAESSQEKPEVSEVDSKDSQPSRRQAGKGLAQTDDHLKEIDTGMQTLLNTREFVYYSYYNRIRNQLQQYWEPSIKAKFTQLMKRGRTIASTGDKLTKILITLNQQGTLVKVQVIEESGIRDLDDAAVEAFQKAAPFPNPPAGIVEQDGTIKIRWDFVVEA